MYEPSIDVLELWSTAVFYDAFHDVIPQSAHDTQHTSHNLPSIGAYGTTLASWFRDQWYHTTPLHDTVLTVDTILETVNTQLNSIIWSPQHDAERTDMFQSENIFNFGDYIWMVSILNSNTPITVFENSLLLDTICKLVFLAVSQGVFSDDQTTMLSQYLTEDLEARGQSQYSFDDREGYDSFRLLLFFYKYADDIEQAAGEAPFEWLLSAWRDIDAVRAMHT